MLYAKGDIALPAYVEGGHGTLASSLDYALTKQPTWLLDMFGVSASGQPRARKLFLVTNRNRKRPGPVVVGLNPRILSAEGISITLDGQHIQEVSALKTMLGAMRVQSARGMAEDDISTRYLPVA